MKLTKIVFIVIFLVFVWTCNQESVNEKLKTLKHENGLMIQISEHLHYNRIANGFIVYPDGGLERRSPLQVSVEYLQNPHQANDWPSTKSIGGKTIYSRASQQSGGSGGTEFLLETSLAPQGHVALSIGYIKTYEVIQSEYSSQPDFMSWDIISKATYSIPEPTER